MKHRIFISHSTHETADTPILAKLVEVLSPQFHTFVDKTNLNAGDEWRPKLIRELGMCDGAVVLINERALDPQKKWVETEANILRWRRWNEPDFPLLLVRIGEVTTERIEKLWPALDFIGLQMLPKGKEQLTSENLGAAGALFDEILAVLKPLTDRDRKPGPFEEMRDAIANAIRDAVGDSNVKHVWFALQDLGIADDEIGNADPWKLLADVLIEQGPSPANAKALKDHLGTFMLFSNDGLNRLERILDLVVPHWVSPIAACNLARLKRMAGPPPVFGVNARKSLFTGAHYLQRACCRAQGLEWKHVEVQPKVGSKVVDAVLDQVREGLRVQYSRGFQKRGLANPDDTEIKRRLARGQEPVFVILPPPLAQDDQVIAAIRSAFDELVLLCLTGDDFKPIPAKDVVYIEPRLMPGEEQQAYDNYYDALDVI